MVVVVPIYVVLIGSVSYEAWLCVWWFIPCSVISLLQSCYKLDKNITLYSWLFVSWLVISLELSLYNKLDKNIYKFFDLMISSSSLDVLKSSSSFFFFFWFHLTFGQAWRVRLLLLGRRIEQEAKAETHI